MKIFRIIIMMSFFIMLTCQLFAQEEERNMPWDIWRNPTTTNFTSIQSEAQNWFENRDRGRGSGYKQWQRWEEENKTRLDQNGNIVNKAPIYYESYRNEMKKLAKEGLQRNMQGDWKAWSGKAYRNVGSWSPGIGRVNVIAYHPTDPNTLYVGTPAGGLFRTTNNGNTWTCLTDALSSIGVSGIAIHPDQPNIIYILTGDGDGGNTRSIGVFKTIDGGVNWNPTGLTWSLNSNISGFKLVMEPGDPTYLIVAASNGLHRTTNSGANWSLVSGGAFTDIEYKPGVPSNVYASSAGQLWKSTNWGGSWTLAYTVPNGASRTQIAVTPDNPEVVYLMNGPYDSVNSQPGFRGVFRSSNSGASFSMQSNTPNILGGSVTSGGDGDQSDYDLAIACSPVNDSIILTGGVNIYRSVNTGLSLTLEGHWNVNDIASNPNFNLSYIHADIHHISYNPLNNRAYAGTDGGIFFSDDNGENWTDITAGLNISQIYHFDGKDSDPNYMLAGFQDNGTCVMKKDSLLPELGADGGDCLLHPTNDNIMYAMWQNGTVRKTTDKGANWNSISPTGLQNGPFVTRWDMDRNNPDTIYMGWTNNNIYRTFNGGANWSLQSTPGQGADINSISVADNGSTIYASSSCRVFRSFNRGANWFTIYTVPSTCIITSVAKMGGDPTKAVITIGGFGGGVDRVLLWDDDDDTIIPIKSPLPNSSDTLPPVPVNIAATSGVSGLGNIYVGTDIGVYYFSYLNPGAGWQYFKKGLPNVPVRDIKIYDEEGIMRIATFGRGVWQSDVWDDCAYNLTLTQGNDPTGGFPGTKTEEAADVINSSRLIAGISNNNVKYKAADAVIMSNGFLAQEGATFIAGNKPCGISLE